MRLLTYKQFEGSVWVDSFNNETKFKPDSKFYKIIEDEIYEFLNSSYLESRDKELPELGDDIIGKIIYLVEFNAKGKTAKFGYGTTITGHWLFNTLQQNIERIILNDAEVIKLTRIKETMREKIERNLSMKISNTILPILFKIVKSELNANEDLYDEYKSYLDDELWADALPDWVSRAKKTRLLDYEIS